MVLVLSTDEIGNVFFNIKLSTMACYWPLIACSLSENNFALEIQSHREEIGTHESRCYVQMICFIGGSYVNNETIDARWRKHLDQLFRNICQLSRDLTADARK